MEVESTKPDQSEEALKFVRKIASLVTLEEYADELSNARAIPKKDALIHAYTEYDSLETVEKLIRWARRICDRRD